MALVHGGQLQQVAQQYNIPVDEWLDLSTGIAPFSYPVPNIPLKLWQQLPQKDPALESAAKQYYQCENILVTNGSQSIIKSLPVLWKNQNPQSKTVHLPERGYKEHAQAWKDAGYQIACYQYELPPLNELSEYDVLVIINPNNPTGKVFSRAFIENYQQAIKRLEGLLVIDEAFIDIAPTTQSLCSMVTDNHTLVLRSFGKFFGLAGIRIGFLVGAPYWTSIFATYLGPWQVNGPAKFIAQKALQDTQWQNQQRIALQKSREKQEALIWRSLGEDIVSDIKGTDLFLTLHLHQSTTAKTLYHELCLQGVYVRLADEQDTLRFGMACSEDLSKLFNVLSLIKEKIINT